MAGCLSEEDLENAARAAAIFAVAQIHAAYNWAVYKKNRDLLPLELKEVFAEIPDVMAMAGAGLSEPSRVGKGVESAEEKDLEVIFLRWQRDRRAEAEGNGPKVVVVEETKAP